MARSTWISAGSFLIVSLLSTDLLAHVQFSYPTPRRPGAGNNDIKTGPCGCSMQACPNGDVRNEDRVTELDGGSTITVRFNETINHPGFYRISFDDDGQDAFDPPPLARSAIQMGTPTLPVLLDNITDIEDGMMSHMYEVDITLPNIDCDNCTLQLIQVMTNAQTWMADDIYYTCADITLRATGSAGAGGMGGAGAGGVAGTMGMAGGLSGASQGGVAGTMGMAGGSSGSFSMGGAGAGAGGMAMAGAGSGGTPAAGMTGVGGAATAGSPSGAGAPPAGGMPGGAGAPGTGGMVGSTGGTATEPPAEEAGCTCRTSSRSASSVFGLAGLAALGGLLLRRKR